MYKNAFVDLPSHPKGAQSTHNRPTIRTPLDSIMPFNILFPREMFSVNDHEPGTSNRFLFRT